MLISWISQMVALLDKPEAVAVQHCIGQIAECYPQALVYALMISSESYQFEVSATGHKQREFVNRPVVWRTKSSSIIFSLIVKVYFQYYLVFISMKMVCVPTGSAACWARKEL